MKTKKLVPDRHRAGSVQLKAWLPETLRERFKQCCAIQGVPVSETLRDLMEAYCLHVDAESHAQLHPKVNEPLQVTLQ